MNVLVIFSGLLSIVVASDVLEFNDSNFEDKIKDHSIALVEFFAPWCGHCKRLAPEFETSATALATDDSPVALVKVDCTANTVICGKHGVSGYPTLKIFRGGEFAEDYSGPRESEGIISHMRKKAGPVSKLLETVAIAEKYLSKSDYAVIGFFESEDDDNAKTFRKVADSSSNVRFAHTYAKEVKDKYEYQDSIVLFQPKQLHSKFEDNIMEYKGDMSLTKVKDWIAESIQGLCGIRKMDNAGDFKTPVFVAYYDVDYVKNPKGTNYIRNRVMKVAQKLAKEGKKATFAVSNSEEFKHELSEFGLSDPDTSKVTVGGRDVRERKFIMSGDFSMDNLEKFVNDVLEGNLEPYMKSEDVPSSQGPVKTVVAKNFDEIVNDETKDVLIEFYAPWCGHCKTLEPKYVELAEKLADEPDIVIAKMDATANDVPSQYDVKGFPTLYFAPKGSKSSPKKYESGREVDAFIEYLAKESTDPLKGYKRDGKKIKKKKTEL